MAERQERRLMRQRGAGPRDLGNVGFSFNFGAASLPLPPQSSRKTPGPSPAETSRKTPQSSLAQRPSARKTPAGSGAKSASASKAGKSASLAPSSGSRSSDGNGPTFKTPVTTGKRKRRGTHLEAVEETEQDELETTLEDIAASRSRSVRPSTEVPASAQKTPAANQIEEPDELSPENDGPAIKNPVREIETPTLLRRLSERRTQRSEGSVAGSVILSIEEDEEVGEDELSFQDTQTTTNVARISSRNRDSSSGLAMATSATDGLNVSLTAPNNQSTRREVFDIPTGEPDADPLPALEDLEDEEDELSPSRTTKSQKSSRTSRPVVVADEDDDDADEDELSPPKKVAEPNKVRRTTLEPPVVTEEIVEDNVSEDELSPVQPKIRRRPEKAQVEARRNPNKRRRVEAPPIEVHQDEAEEEASNIDELSPQPARPAPKSKPQKPRQPLSKATTNLPKKTKPSKKLTARTTSLPRKKTKGDVIGITVYHRTSSNNIAYDSLGSNPTPGITPIDVLAQVSEELANNHILAFQQHARPDNVSKKTKRRQLDVMGYFRDVLASSMSEIQIASLGAHVLGKQVRGVNKRKRQLREELMGRRREREEIEIEIDRVRAKHRERVEKEDKEFELVQSLRDIEGAVRRGREKAREDGREDEVPEVGMEVEGGRGKETLGLLGRVREWNGLLEESALVLEGRT
ncbi:hypothetical protein BLS_004006 [Venturia inaequalis]|uniref:Inner kinetochore subunit AME1 domain-containing protein n=1 Tax=Venturia inaequalis TaxID=5025 RepID=A0A8H3Z8S9_VENIN|nr:hypothetical protein BLS_004006 [Venturia inaequalis]